MRANRLNPAYEPSPPYKIEEFYEYEKVIETYNLSENEVIPKLDNPELIYKIADAYSTSYGDSSVTINGVKIVKERRPDYKKWKKQYDLDYAQWEKDMEEWKVLNAKYLEDKKRKEEIKERKLFLSLKKKYEKDESI